jgi:hypothetical protein
MVQAYLIGQAYSWPWLALFVNPISWVLIGMSILSFLWPYFGSLKQLFQKPEGLGSGNGE